jgi:hypothetical protein
MTCPCTISIVRDISSGRSRYCSSVTKTGRSSSHPGPVMGIIFACALLKHGLADTALAGTVIGWPGWFR